MAVLQQRFARELQSQAAPPRSSLSSSTTLELRRRCDVPGAGHLSTGTALQPCKAQGLKTTSKTICMLATPSLISWRAVGIRAMTMYCILRTHHTWYCVFQCSFLQAVSGAAVWSSVHPMAFFAQVRVFRSLSDVPIHAWAVLLWAGCMLRVGLAGWPLHCT